MARKSNNVVELQTKAVHLQPKSATQDYLLRAIPRHSLVVTMGPAGVGKTWCVVNTALNLLQQGKIERLILSRSNIPTGRTLGAFPGTIEEKMAPWLSPMTSEIVKRLGEGDYRSKLNKGTIQFQPLETIRGASFEKSFIMVDEAQNLTFEEVKAITTRIGEHSHMVLMGDPMQRDQNDSGLVVLKRMIDEQKLWEQIPIVEFSVNDIVRSDIVATLVKAYLKFTP